MQEWCPPGKRGKGLALNSWMQEVAIGTKERGNNNMEQINRNNGEGK